MKSNNGLQIIIRITVCVTMLSSLIGAFMLHSTPSHRESGSVLILVSVAAASLWVLLPYCSPRMGISQSK